MRTCGCRGASCTNHKPSRTVQPALSRHRRPSTGTPGSLSSFASGSLPLRSPTLPPNWDMGFYVPHRSTSVYRDISSAPVREVPRVRGTVCLLNTPYLKTSSLHPLVKRRSVLALALDSSSLRGGRTRVAGRGLIQAAAYSVRVYRRVALWTPLGLTSARLLAHVPTSQAG